MSTTDKTTLVLLPGWVLGSRPLAPLARAIEHLDSRISVHCATYPRLMDHRLETWLEALDTRLPDNVWLGGWSMGGMLATALAERRGSRTPGLITMGAGAQVVPSAPSDWRAPNPRAWASLLRQGQHDARHLGKRLLHTLPRAGARQSAKALALLAGMDLRQTLGRLAMPQLHLFGEQDMMIPASTRQSVAQCLSPAGQIQLIAGTGHGLVIDQVDQTARAITAFMQANSEVENNSA